MSNLYEQNTIDHYKNPRNFGELKGATYSHEKNNPSCGDRLKVQLLVEKGIIKQVKFTGEGCAISMASMSMLSDELVGKKLSEVEELDFEYVKKLLGVPVSEHRYDCAMLGIQIVQRVKSEEL